jgi:FKBP-type peptidyl-prolyl cis-trans isomerase FklB
MRITPLVVTALLAGVATAPETGAASAQEPVAPGATAATGADRAPQHPGPTPPRPESLPAKGEDAPAAGIHNAKEKLSYALGVDFAFRLKWQRVDVDLELLVKGLQDASANDESQLLIPAKQAALTVKEFQVQRQRGLEHALGMLSEKNGKAGATFVAENARKDGVVTMPSGLQYKVLKAGDGRKPTLADDVQCHYRGTFVDGTEFDSSYKGSEPPTFPLKRSIKGWQEAVPLMAVGSRWQIVVPPQLAYGERGSGLIGPNATLVFEVELISIPERAQGDGAPPSGKPESAS